MSKLLSDEELRVKLANSLYEYNEVTREKKDYDKAWKDFSGYVTDLINTQKRLYAESIVDTSKEIFLTHSNGEFELGYVKGRKDLRAEQRARIK